LSLSSSRTPHPPPPTLFPYTTLFRSEEFLHHGQFRGALGDDEIVAAGKGRPAAILPRQEGDAVVDIGILGVERADGEGAGRRDRSEEHTSELQSRFDLVCRLLLEKKK